MAVGIISIVIIIWIASSLHGWFSGKSEQIRRKHTKLRQEFESKEKVLVDGFQKREKALQFEEERAIDLKQAVLKMAKEKSSGFPFLAKAYDEYFEFKDMDEEYRLINKKHPAIVTARKYKEAATKKREILFRNRILRYQIEYYEYLFPWLTEYKDAEMDDEAIERYLRSKQNKDEEGEGDDPVKDWLPEAEYNVLSLVVRNQKALDRYWNSKKSPWEIGRLYERYIGYLYEQLGYNVAYHGILEGFDDMGRDLICKKPSEVIIVQCKCWQHHKTIHEKHINQLYGTCAKYLLDIGENVTAGDLFTGFKSNTQVKAHFITSAQISDRARKFAEALGIYFKENFVLEKFPCVKCNVSRIRNELIYHLPFDQQYDKVIIEPNRGEFYTSTVAEAEERGFRRAWKWRGNG